MKKEYILSITDTGVLDETLNIVLKEKHNTYPTGFYIDIFKKNKKSVNISSLVSVHVHGFCKIGVFFIEHFSKEFLSDKKIMKLYSNPNELSLYIRDKIFKLFVYILKKEAEYNESQALILKNEKIEKLKEKQIKQKEINAKPVKSNLKSKGINDVNN